MLAILASALLGLYVFLPVFLFDRLAIPFRLKGERTRTEEIFTGILVSGIPVFAAWSLSKCCVFVGHHPFAVPDTAFLTKIDDYQRVIAAMYSDSYFRANESAFWKSGWIVLHYQLRFFVWTYSLLTLEIVVMALIVQNFGKLNQYDWFKRRIGPILLSKTSEWQPLLTSFVFHPREKRTVEVDVMTTDGHLYRGTVENYFLKPDASLSGILLKEAKRFQYSRLEADRVRCTASNEELPPIGAYWKVIPGANLVIPFDKVVTLNIRYELQPDALVDQLQKWLHKQEGMTDLTIDVENKPETEPPASTAPPA
ncbi:MAG: hypothetical protein CXZ00_15265 [Acidobacteria bacterium]|nr:MAG: hypothetical protein CXZ00_15265 [Acidobacteriota bacterium]